MSSAKPIIIECGHCGNRAPMAIIAEYTDHLEYGDPPHTDESSTKWELLLCPSCRKPILHQTYWDTFNIDIETGPEVSKKVLYPSPVAVTDGLPDKVHKSYEAALRVRNVEPNAFAVLIGRTLEFVCQDKDADGRTLNAKLDNLSERNEIPGRLAEMAHKLRALRNIGAHADKGEISERDVPILIDFTETILDYIYRAPAKLEAVKKRIEKRETDLE